MADFQTPEDNSQYGLPINTGDLPEPPWLKLLKASQGYPTSNISNAFVVNQPLTPQEQRLAGEPDLKSETNRLSVNQKLLSAVGEKTKPVLGALTPVLKVLDTPRAIAFSAGHELVDAATGGQSSWQDFLTQAKEHKGFGDTQALQFKKGDSTAQRVGKAFGAFAGDLLSDPLSYLTFGVGPIGKRAAAEAIALATKKIAEDSVVKTGIEASKFSAEAGEAYLRNRSRGVKDYLVEQLGKEEGTKAFENLPSYAKGGVGFQVPFTNKRFGNVNAGGSLTDAIKFGDESLGSLIAPLHQNYLTALTAIGQKTGLSSAAALLGGVHGKDFQAVMKDLNSKNLSRNTFQQYLIKKEITKNVIDFHGSIIDTGASVVTDALRIKNENPDLYTKAQKLFINPAMLREALSNPSTASNPEVEAAKHLYEAFNEITSMAEKANVPINELEDYMTLRLTADELARRKKEKIVKRAEYNASIAGFNPTKQRVAYTTNAIDPKTGELLLDADGMPVQRMMTPDEINAQRRSVGLPELAEEDPVKLLSVYFDAMASILPRHKLVNDFVDAGLLIPGERKLLNLDAAKLAEFGKRLTRELPPEELAKLEDRIGLNLWQVDDELLSVVTDPAKLNQFFETLDPLNPEDIGKIDDLINVLIRNENSILVNSFLNGLFTDFGITDNAINEARNNVEYLMNLDPSNYTVVANNIIREKPGYKQYGAEGGVKVPDYLVNVFGPEHIIDGLENIFSLNPRSPHNAAFRDAAVNGLKEFMRFFRTGATVGRLSGFVMRNGLGTVWQNAVAGVRAADYKASGIIASKDLAISFMVAAMERAKGENAIKYITSVEDKLPKELTDRLTSEVKTYGFILPSSIKDIKLGLLYHELNKIKTIDGKATYYDIYKTAEKAGVYDSNRILGVYEGESLDQTTRSLINSKLKANVAPDKYEENLNKWEKFANSVLNVGPAFTLKSGRRVNLKPTQLTIALNTRTEQFARTAAIAAGLRRYGYDTTGEELSAMLMKAVHFDYQDLSPFEQRVMRNILPFYTWVRNNIALEFRTMLFNPGQINNLMRGWEDFKEVVSDESGNIYIIPSWITERYGFVTKFKHGDYPLMLSLESPLMDINKYFNQPQGLNPLSMIDYQEFLSGVNPLIKEPVQFWSQKNLFTGAPYSVQGVTPPAYLKYLDELTGNKILQYDKQGNRTVNQKYLDLVNETLPQMGVLARLAPGVFGTDNQQQRLVSNYLSGILGLPVATLTSSQEVGEGRSLNQAYEARLSQAAGKKGLDYQKLRQYSYLPEDKIKELIDKGFFNLPNK